MTTRRLALAPTLAAGLALLAAGCESGPTADQVVPIDQVPPNLMEIARKQLPAIKFDTAFKMKGDGKDAYEIRGRNKQGKVREVELSATGEVIEVE